MHQIRIVYLYSCVIGASLWVVPLPIGPVSILVLVFAQSGELWPAGEPVSVVSVWLLGMLLWGLGLGQLLRGLMLVWYALCLLRASQVLSVIFASAPLMLLSFLTGKISLKQLI